MTLYFPLKGHGLPPLDAVGGKARALIEATGAGFSVPDGFVLAVDFFAPWMQTIKQSAPWTDLLQVAAESGQATPADGGSIKQKCDSLQDLCRTLMLSDAQRNDLDAAMSSFAEGDLFAIRSSSPEEDLAKASFAGGYETTLGVIRATLDVAIVTCFASMLDELVVAYKRRNQIPIDNPRIAVIVQQQIASEVSGVAFSLNPQNNAYDEAVINANFGLGETVVAGQVTPDTYIVEQVKREILDRQVAAKSHAIWLMPDGGTEKRPNDPPDAPTLSDGQVLEVAALAKSVEAHFGNPCDIEWAIHEDTLYLLQSRPITTYLPLFPEMVTAPGEPKHLYLDVIVITQGFSDSLSVLGSEIWSRMLTIAKGPTMPEGPGGVVWTLHGRQYLHVSNMLKALGQKLVKKQWGSFDTPTRTVFDSLDLAAYVPEKKPPTMRGYV